MAQGFTNGKAEALYGCSLSRLAAQWRTGLSPQWGTTWFWSAACGSWPPLLYGLYASGGATQSQPGSHRWPSALFASVFLSVLSTRPKVGSGCHSYQAITTGIWFTMRDGSSSSGQYADEICGLRIETRLEQTTEAAFTH